MSSVQIETAVSAASAFLYNLVYRAGFDKGDVTPLLHPDGGWLILLPSYYDPEAFKVRDLGHMLNAYGLKYRLASLHP